MPTDNMRRLEEIARQMSEDRFRLLIVEDEPRIAEIVAANAESSMPVEIVCCPTRECALQRIEASEEGFDLLWLDMVLPDGRGIDVAREVRKRQHNTNIVICTGYEIDALVLRELLNEIRVFTILRKPMTRTEIRMALQLAAGSGPCPDCPLLMEAVK